MNVKSITTLALFVLYCLFCWKYYTCEIKDLCYNKVENTSSSTAETYPIQFYKNATNYKLSSAFDQYADSIVKSSIGKKLDIIGYYDPSESNASTFANLGLARASALRDVLKSKGLDTTGISLFGIKRSLDFKDSLAWATAIDTSANVNLNSTDVQLITHHGITEIYFPTGSTQEIKSAVLDSFLSNLAQTSADKKISLVGHTDNVGEEKTNQELSLQRSQSIRNILVKLGVKPDNILCEGKGSAIPKRENNSDENRALNRRVEISVE